VVKLKGSVFVVMSRPFDNPDYLRYDIYKHLFIFFLESRGYTVAINRNKYGVDLFACHDNKPMLKVDVEVKDWDWTNQGNFPFPTVHFTDRKAKFGTGADFIYVIISTNKKAFLYQTGEMIYRDENRITKKVTLPSGSFKFEDFFQLPKNKVIFKKFDWA